MTTQARFWSKVAQVGNVCECWIWTAVKVGKGYGRFTVGDGIKVLAHRFAYESVIGPIPAGLQIDHLCRTKDCCNPFHLEPVTNAENVRRATPFHPMTNRVHCPQGHPYDAVNTRMYRGARHCRECGRVASRAWKVKVGY